MRIILDTSVLISVLISRGKSYVRDVIRLAFEQKITLLASNETFEEFRTALHAEKIKQHINYKSAKIGSFVAWYKYNVQFIILPTDKASSIITRDNSDIIYLLLADASKADYLLTIDKDLLELQKHGETKIVIPETFITREKSNF